MPLCKGLNPTVQTRGASTPACLCTLLTWCLSPASNSTLVWGTLCSHKEHADNQGPYSCLWAGISLVFCVGPAPPCSPEASSSKGVPASPAAWPLPQLPDWVHPGWVSVVKGEHSNSQGLCSGCEPGAGLRHGPANMCMSETCVCPFHYLAICSWPPAECVHRTNSSHHSSRLWSLGTGPGGSAEAPNSLCTNLRTPTGPTKEHTVVNAATWAKWESWCIRDTQWHKNNAASFQ